MQSSIRVQCPNCAFSRDLPGEKVPDRPVRVTCPKCEQTFDFQKPALLPSSSGPPAATSPTPQPDNRPTAASLPAPSPPGSPAVEVPLESVTRKPSTEKPRPVLPPAHWSKVRELPGVAWDLLRRRWLLLGLSGCLLALIAVSFCSVSSVESLLPLLKSGSMPVQGRQVITIPPPSGELPAGFPLGSGAGVVSAPPAAMSPTIEIGPAPGPATAGSPLRATDLSVFIYAVNAPGTIRVNGQEFKTIKSEPDMQYNINTFGEQFRPGENTIEFDVTPSPEGGRRLSPEIQMKVSQGERVLGEWRLSAKDGWPRSVTVAIPAGQAP